MNILLKKLIILVISILILFYLLILPKYVSIGSINLLELQRNVIEWNYIGVTANYLLFIILFKYSKKTLSNFGVHIGKFRKNIRWFIIITIFLITLFRIIAILTNGSLKFQVPTISTIIFQLFYVAFGEELFWRGYVQTEYGIGIASISFGFIHFLNIFGRDIPLTQAIIWGITATVLGFIMGYIRKKTDSIYASSIFHGLFNISNHFFIPL